MQCPHRWGPLPGGLPPPPVLSARAPQAQSAGRAQPSAWNRGRHPAEGLALPSSVLLAQRHALAWPRLPRRAGSTPGLWNRRFAREAPEVPQGGTNTGQGERCIMGTGCAVRAVHHGYRLHGGDQQGPLCSPNSRGAALSLRRNPSGFPTCNDTAWRARGSAAMPPKQCRRQQAGCEVRSGVLAFPRRCGTLGKSHTLTGPQFPCMSNGTHTTHMFSVNSGVLGGHAVRVT